MEDPWAQRWRDRSEKKRHSHCVTWRDSPVVRKHVADTYLDGCPELLSWFKSKYVPEAEKLAAEAKGLFVERDWYVAGFYRNRDRWEGVAFRMEHLLKEYPGSRYESRALYQLAEAYLKMNERYRAQQALQQLIVKHPDDPLRPQAEKLLAGLR